MGGEAARTAADFLALFGVGPLDAVTFQCFDDGARKRSHLARVIHSTLADCADQLAAIGAMGAGIFWTVSACDGAGRKLANYRHARAVWVDVDRPGLDWLAGQPEPTAVVRTAAGHHAYWRLTDGADVDAAALTALCRRAASACGGDASATDAVRVMRLPGYMHRKGEPVDIEVIERSSATYTYEDLAEAWPAADGEHGQSVADAAHVERAALSGESTRYGLAALAAEERRIALAPVGERNNALNRAAFSVGQLVAGGELEIGALDVVAAAAVGAGLSAGETMATVRSAGRASAAHPRRRPERPTPPGGARRPALRAASAADAEPVELSDDEKRAAELSLARQALPLRWRYGRDGMTLIHAVDHAAAAVILANDPEMKGKISYDNFRGQLVTVAELPSGPGLLPVDAGVVVDDGVEGAILGWMAAAWPQGRWDVSHVRSGLRQISRLVHHDTLRQWAMGAAAAWDHVDRLGAAAATYFGSPGETAQLAVRLWFLSAAARAVYPGAKADSVLVLTGAEGVGKSTTVEALCPRGQWFLRGLPPLTGEESARFLSGKFLVEIDELDAFRRADGNRVKAFLSRPTDSLRWIYERNSVDLARRCAMVVTLNPEAGGWLTEAMGLRRWYTLLCGRCAPAKAAADATQLWGQAVSEVLAGASWWPTEDERGRLAHEAEYHTVGDSLQPWVDEWLSMPERRDKPVQVYELLRALGHERHQIRRSDEMRAAELLRVAGYVRTRAMDSGRRAWRWVRADEQMTQISRSDDD